MTTNSQLEKLPDYDVLDVVLPVSRSIGPRLTRVSYGTISIRILNIMFGYLTSDQRKEVEVYLAEKKYLPPLKLHLPN